MTSSTTIPVTIVTGGDVDIWETATNGMIFEFKEMARADAFAAAVKNRFGLDCRVFDDAEAAQRAHLFPWVQYPPVVHVDRPIWSVMDSDVPRGEARDEAWNKAYEIERKIEKLAKKLGGTFVGT